MNFLWAVIGAIINLAFFAVIALAVFFVFSAGGFIAGIIALVIGVWVLKMVSIKLEF